MSMVLENLALVLAIVIAVAILVVIIRFSIKLFLILLVAGLVVIGIYAVWTVIQSVLFASARELDAAPSARVAVLHEPLTERGGPVSIPRALGAKTSEADIVF